MDSVTGKRETVCKIRRLTLNYSESQTVNFDVIKALELRGCATERVTFPSERKIKRKKVDGRIHTVTEPEDKIYRDSFLKRRCLCDITPFPSVMFKRGVG